VKVFDVFNYNGEPVADFRTHLLSGVVHEHVVVEGTHTFTGERKPVLYSHGLRRDITPLHYITTDAVVPGDAWATEAAQRNAPIPYLIEHAGDDDLILCSDADEMINPDDIDAICGAVDALGGAALILQDFYYYNLNWKKPTDWPNAFACRVGMLKRYTIQEMRGRVPIGIKSGWHISYAETRENIRRKIESFAHTECNRPEFKTDEHLDRCLREGLDLFGRTDQHLIAVSDAGLPEPLRDFNHHIRMAQCGS